MFRNMFQGQGQDQDQGQGQDQKWRQRSALQLQMVLALTLTLVLALTLALAHVPERLMNYPEYHFGARSWSGGVLRGLNWMKLMLRTHF